jgi:methylated-DNA-[protein]-cysteine S-methyltransferase
VIDRSHKLFTTIRTPIGEVLLRGNASALTGVFVMQQKHAPLVCSDWERKDEFFANTIVQLDEYFRGVRKRFEVPFELEGTEFQKRVWRQLEHIPYGKTCAYVELAERIGNSKASRAVGLANGRNPLSIIVPCHRVIGANGALTGYGGGVAAKQWLLDHERKHAATFQN